MLLAEDNLINQSVARKMLTSLGMTCTVASNGAEAVTAAGTQRFDCVLMDMMMPVMNGVDATRALRGKGLTLPIIAMTANAGDTDRAECLAAGMDGFLSKPVLKEQLAAALTRVLNRAGATP